MKFFSKRDQVADIVLFIASQLILTPILILLISGFIFILGGAINIFIFPISLLFGFVIAILLHRGIFNNGRRDILKYIFLFLIFFVIYIFAFFTAKTLYDISWDGQEYHQEAIIQLGYNKWNPVFEEAPPSTEKNLKLWIEHYGKGSEIIAASIVNITNAIETGKMFNILLIFSSFFMALGAILKYSKIDFKWSLLSSFVLAFNPVSVYQSLSYYLDGQMSSLCVILLVIGFCILQKGMSKYLYIWFGTIVFLINLKLTGIVFAGIACIGLLIFTLLQRNFQLFKKVFIISVVASLIGILVVGYNPYVRNTFEHKSPLYPLVGSDNVDILTTQTPPNLVPVGDIKKFIISHFLLENTGRQIHLRIPFLPNIENKDFYSYADIRLGGEGLFFMEISVLAIIVLIGVLWMNKKNKENLYLLVLLALLSFGVLIIPANWWARYVPFLFIIPCVVLIYSLTRRSPTFFVNSLLFTMLVNFIAVSAIYFNIQTKNTISVNNMLHEMEKSPIVYVYSSNGWFMNNIERFRENGINYEIIKNSESWDAIDLKTSYFPGSSLQLKYSSK